VIQIRQTDLRDAWQCQVFHIELTVMRMPGTQRIQALMVGIEV